MKNKTTKTTISTILALLIMAMSAYSQNINFSPPQTMGATINSASNDANAVISPNGLSLYFTSRRTGNADIYVSQRASLSSPWGAPQNLGATVNTNNADEEIGGFSLDGKTMFLDSTRSDSLGVRDNYISMRTDPNDDFGWTTPVNLGPVVNSPLEDFAATYFEDPITGAGSIFFGSNRIGNPNIDYHIYQSTRNPNGTFNPPTPIPELNVGAEIKVAIQRDGLQMFIMATGPPPATFDIYVSTRASTTSSWSSPTLVPGINSETQDGSPSLSPDGMILYFHSGRSGGSGGNDLYSVTLCSVYTTTPCLNRSPTAEDFDGDGRADLSVFRPSDGTWHVLKSGSNIHQIQPFGVNGDRVVPGDYDGDGRTDLAVFRPSDPAWWIFNSSNNTFSVTQFGLATDKLTPGDYDGDGRTDIAIYRNGTWWIRQSSNGLDSVRQFGLSGDIPVAGTNVP